MKKQPTLTDPEIQLCPFSTYEWLRKEAPVYKDPISGIYEVMRYEDVSNILADPVKFSNKSEQFNNLGTEAGKKSEKMLREEGVPPMLTLINNDPPEHRKLRSLLEKSFNIDSIKANEPMIADLANSDVDMLLTSREQPAGLRNERLFTDGNHALHGLGDGAGVELFFQHSVKAKEDARAHADFALAVQHAADGHPLAIALLAGEYDVSAVPMLAFLGNWQDELASARRGGLAGHHVTLTIAFERSYAHLSKDLQEKLVSLSIFPFPFFAHGAVMIWDGSHLPDGEEEIDVKVKVAQQTLSEFTRRSLLEVDATYEDDTPATYRFQPALRQEAVRRLDVALAESQQVGYAAYGAWLAKRGYASFESDIALNRLVRLSLDAMDKAIDYLDGTERLWHIRRLAWLKNTMGENKIAFELLKSSISINLPNTSSDPENAKVDSALRYDLAGYYVLHGGLYRALELYKESLHLSNQLSDPRGETASLAGMAQILLTQGDFNNALKLYEQCLKLDEQIGDVSGKAATLSSMGQVFFAQGDLDRAQKMYEKSLTLYEQIGDVRGKAKALSSTAQIFLSRNDLDRTLQLYQESLQLSEQIGDKQGKASSLQHIAGIYQINNNRDEALDLLKQGIVLLENAASKGKLLISLYIEYAKLKLEVGSWAEAEKNCQIAINIARDCKENIDVAYGYQLLGDIRSFSRDYRGAILRYEASRKMFNQVNRQDLVADALKRIGLIAIQVGEYNDGLIALEEAQSIFSKIKLRDEAANVKKIIIDLSSKMERK